MTPALPTPITKLADSLSALPGIGPKLASRIAVYMATRGKHIAYSNLIKGLEGIASIGECTICGNLTEQDICSICLDASRDQSLLLVVENVLDLQQFESTQSFAGRYIVLGQLISPINGVAANDTNLHLLEKYLSQNKVAEVVIGLASSVEGEATTLLIARQIKGILPDATITRLAKGISAGMSVEYMDSGSLQGALDNRTTIM